MVTTTLPQLAVFAAQLAGPLTPVPPGPACETDEAAVWPLLPSTQLMLAVFGDMVGVVLLQLLSDSAGGVALTVRFTGVEAAVPPGVGDAESVPL